ncbi:MAG TPA: four helix bundle protein [Gemmatimonadaceae bacterium]|nr:four helix bundle protein [Gemmatimonadaceae bacterium]
MNPKARELHKRLLNFGVATTKYASKLSRTFTGKSIAWQLRDSCMSPASNYSEAQSAESKRDFVHKVQICLKELNETATWLGAAAALGPVTEELNQLRRECDELIAIFTKIVKTAKDNM